MGSAAEGARLDGGIPPHCRNQRLPTAGDTPAIAAASSLVCPCAIAFQNGHRSARCSTGGLPGDRSLDLSDRSDFNFFCFINTSGQDVLQRLVKSTQYAGREYRKLATFFGIMMSMSRRTNCCDNAAMESFFKTLKIESIYQVPYDTRAQARLGTR